MANETDLFRYSVALPEGSGGDTFHLLLNSLQQSQRGFLQWDPCGHGLCRETSAGEWMVPLGPEDGRRAAVAALGGWQGGCPAMSLAAGEAMRSGIPGDASSWCGADGTATSEKSYGMQGGIQNLN